MESSLFRKLMSYCSKAERCQQDVQQWLYKKEVPEEQWPEVIAQLEENRFISEERYARAYASDKLRFNDRGPLRIRAELLSKGIDEDIIDKAIADVLDENDGDQLLTRLIEKRIESLESLEGDTLQSKVIQWAYAKGWPFDSIMQTLKQILSNNSDKNL